jgi:tetratricopeptide (TPR) repeat protein
MKRVWIGLGLLLLAGLAAFGVAWKRSHSVPRQLAQANATLGTPAAGDILAELAARHPDHAEVLFVQARHARLAGNNELALANLQRAADLGWPKEETDRERLLALAQKDFARAEGPLHARLNLAPDDRDVRLALAQGYLRRRYHEQAENLLTPFLDRYPDDGPALALRGRIRVIVGRLDPARLDLEKALRLGPDQYYAPDVRLMLATCLLDLGRFAEAFSLFQACLAEYPNHTVALLGLGRSARLLAGTDPKYWDEAERAFQELRRLQPGDVIPLLELAYVYEQRSEFPKALAVLEAAEQLESDHYEIYFRLAKVLQALGQNERAAVYQQRYDEEDRKHFRKTQRPAPDSTPPAKEPQPAPGKPPAK